MTSTAAPIGPLRCDDCGQGVYALLACWCQMAVCLGCRWKHDRHQETRTTMTTVAYIEKEAP